MKLEIGSKLAFRLALAERKQLTIMNAHAIAYFNRLVSQRFPDTPFLQLDWGDPHDISWLWQHRRRPNSR